MCLGDYESKGTLTVRSVLCIPSSCKYSFEHAVAAGMKDD